MLRPLFALMLCWLAASPVMATAADETPPPAASLEELDRRIGERMAEARIPGMGVVVIEGGQIVLSKGYGHADLQSKTPVTEDTVFRAGSISKSLTAIAAMMLVEEGRLSLDAKLADLMPELRFENPWESTHPVRLVHLLEHTAGFDDIDFRHYLIEGKDITLAEAVDLYGPYQSRWKPGTMSSYCNAGPVIVGRIIEKLSGQSFPAFMAERLHGPLGMASAYWTREPAISDRIARSYADTEGTEEPYVEIAARPSGSLNVTARDLAMLPLLMLGRGTLDGRTYLRPESVERIERPQTTDGARAGLRYGHGLGNMVYPGDRAVFHGHDGGIDGFLAKTEYAPGLGLGFVVMANLGTREVIEISDEIRRYLERGLPTVVLPASQPVPAADLEAWAGTYQSITPRQQKLALLGVLGWQKARADGGALLFNDARRIHLGGGIFQREDRPMPNLVFVRDGNDVILHTTSGSDRRLPAWQVVTTYAYFGAFGLALLATLIYSFVWIPGGLRGRLRERGGVSIRLLPWLAMVATVALAGVTVVLLSSNDLELIAKPSAPAWAVCLLSLAVPFLGVAALVRAALHSDARWPVRALAWLNAIVVLVFAGYLQAYGWIGMRLWA